MEISCLIIDDEPLARKRLQRLVDELPDLELLGQEGTGRGAVEAIREQRPEMIFLDIQMKDMTGFDVLQALEEEERPLVVFVTAFDEYAIQAFDHFAFDYLLKPFKKDRFMHTVERVRQHVKRAQESKMNERLLGLLKYVQHMSVPQRRGAEARIGVRTGRSVHFVELSSVHYVLASGSYVDIHAEDKVHVHRSSLHLLLKELGHSKLLRIHRSAAVHVDAVSKVTRTETGEMELVMCDAKSLRVSKSYRKAVSEALGLA